MALINMQDTDGTKALLAKGELGYDDYVAGGDSGRVYVGDGTENIPLSKKEELDDIDTRVSNIEDNTYTKTESDNLLSKQTIAQYHSQKISGTMEVTNLVETPTQVAITYTGNGTSQSIVTGMSTIDFTQPSNGTGYWLSRASQLGAGVIQDGSPSLGTSTATLTGSNNYLDNIPDTSAFSVGQTIMIFDSGNNPLFASKITNIVANNYIEFEDVFDRVNGTSYYVKEIVTSGHIDFASISGIDGVSNVHIKAKSITGSHTAYDGLRGTTKWIATDLTSSEGTTQGVTAFNDTGFTVGSSIGVNTISEDYIAYQTLYTNISWGTTNHGKLYVTAYNPQSLDVMTYYVGSGIAGHELPTEIGREVSFGSFKNLIDSSNWIAGTNNSYGYLNDPAEFNDAFYEFTKDSIVVPDSGLINGSNDSTIFYGFANAYYNEDGKLIGNKEVIQRAGKGSATKIASLHKPAEIITKVATGSIGNWLKTDNQIGSTSKAIKLNLSDTEFSFGSGGYTFENDGYTINETGTAYNSTGNTYIDIVSYDTKLNGGGAYQDLPSDTTNLVIDAKVNVVDGTSTNGVVSKTVTIDETIDTSSITESGEYYVLVKGD